MVGQVKSLQDKVSELIAMSESHGIMAIHEGRTDNKLQVRFNSRLYAVIGFNRQREVSVRFYYQRDTGTDLLSEETFMEYLGFYSSKIKERAI
jgi:hypothetical protein